MGTRGGGAARRRRAGIPGPAARAHRALRRAARAAWPPPFARLPPGACPRLRERVPTPPARPGSRHPPSPPLNLESEPPTRPASSALQPTSLSGLGGAGDKILARPFPIPSRVPVSTLGKARKRPQAPIGPPGAAGWCCHGNRMVCEAVKRFGPGSKYAQWTRRADLGRGRSLGASGDRAARKVSSSGAARRWCCQRLWEAGEGLSQGSPPRCLGLASVQADEVSAFGWSVFLPGYLVSNPVSSFLVLWQLLPSQSQRVRNLGLPGSQKSCPLPDPSLPLCLTLLVVSAWLVSERQAL